VTGESCFDCKAKKTGKTIGLYKVGLSSIRDSFSRIVSSAILTSLLGLLSAKMVAEQVGIGFELPLRIAAMVPNVPKSGLQSKLRLL
jgi:hypothetical protein